MDIIYGFMINLRDYQKEAIANIEKAFENGNRQYIVMPTGSGKTITFLAYAKKNHRKVLVIVPSRQLSMTLGKFQEKEIALMKNSMILKNGKSKNMAVLKMFLASIYASSTVYEENIFSIFLNPIFS